MNDPIEFTTDQSLARELDASDDLASFRDRFYIPKDTIYLDGNSLGLLSKDGEAVLERIVRDWKELAIGAWFDAEPRWIDFAERLGAELAAIVGARPEEVVATGTTTVNLHAIVGTLYQPSGRRTKILADDLTFPSDIYALESQVRLKGLEPSEQLVFAPTINARFIDEEGLIEMMTEEVALTVLPSVLYRSGQLLDVERVAAEARARGILVGFDCSHSVGALPHDFDGWDIDFAFGCSYKYLNGGPGCPGFLFVNRRHFAREPALAGWFGFAKDKQFDMLTTFEHARGAGGWQIGSPTVLGLAPIEGGIRITREAGIDRIRKKSLRMTSYMMFLIDELLPMDKYGFEIGTPREPGRRGGHVALEHPTHATGVYDALIRRRIVGDLRPPNVIRLAPSPLYCSYQDIYKTVQEIKAIVDGGEHER